VTLALDVEHFGPDEQVPVLVQYIVSGTNYMGWVSCWRPLARVRQDVFEFVAQSTRTAWTRSPSQVLDVAGGTEVVF
jgi:hypothetical protein